MTIAAADRPAATEPAPAAALLRELALGALPRMYRPDRGLFAFRLRRDGGRDVLEGASRRYTAIVLLGLAGEEADAAREILHRRRPEDVCGRLVEEVAASRELGEVALCLWAARAWDHPGADAVLQHLRAMQPETAAHPTVELAWALTALVVGGREVDGRALADALARRLLASCHRASGVFAHWPSGAQPSWTRAHVSCFADLVYPVQALSHYHRRTGDAEAAFAAQQCANHMCATQGPAGQWWWHHDVRTGRVVERFPVYAVHQDAMAPLALFALREAFGTDRSEAIDRGIRWLFDPPEIAGSLIDAEAGVIWRKVGRHEPGKLARGVQAAASRVHPSLRVPGTDLVLPPGRIDFETRPYHLGWILYAFPPGRADTPAGRGG